ncbi:MAG UNVERIFIED_CONTAM: bifunctional folylpolyglutamate synthase/dihydrofolate synthase [Planctomycetaceae bacterium]|jgi:dihydrofolate synthase/folylpolyglutamate synthase
MNVRESSDSSDYRQALDWLYNRTDYERTRPADYSPFRLERTQRLLRQLGNPQLRTPAVHIAGTKGKGSTAAMIDSILRQAGIRTGLFTSPHIAQFEERMRVCGNQPTPQQLTSLIQRLRLLLDHKETLPEDRHPTFFEATTLLAWMFFTDEQIDIAVLETGLGGRLDCTNVCRPLVTVITSIGFDHMQILGNTLSLIAGEKAGIIKPQVPVVEGMLPAEASAVVASRAEQLQAPRFVCGQDFTWISETPHIPGDRSQIIQIRTPQNAFPQLQLPLLGKHQAHNASLAVMACEVLQQNGWPQISPAAIKNGLRLTRWPLRFEIFAGTPPVILDAAHNPDSMSAVCQLLRETEWRDLDGTLIFAVAADKDADAMLLRPATVPRCGADAIQLQSPQRAARSFAAGCSSAVQAVTATPRLHVTETPEAAFSLASSLAAKTGYVLATGSIFLAAEIRGILLTARPLETHAPPMPPAEL